MTVSRITIFCVFLAQLVTVAGCSARSPAGSGNATDAAYDRDRARYYDATAHYNAVKNLWFGLDDPIAGRPGY